MVGAGLLCVAGVTVTPSFEAMFADFGAPLPTLTRVMLSPWTPAALVVPAAVSLLITLRTKTLRMQRAMLVLGFFAVAVAGSVYLYGMYLPIFETANAIKYS